jgi:hypothetical protein
LLHVLCMLCLCKTGKIRQKNLKLNWTARVWRYRHYDLSKRRWRLINLGSVTSQKTWTFIDNLKPRIIPYSIYIELLQSGKTNLLCNLLYNRHGRDSDSLQTGRFEPRWKQTNFFFPTPVQTHPASCTMDTEVPPRV